MRVFFNYFILSVQGVFLLAPLTCHAYSIMTFGDSITVGKFEQLDPGNGRRVGGYQPPLESLFQTAGITTQVYNWGLSGETTQMALQGGRNVCQYVGIDPETGEAVQECAWVSSRSIQAALEAQGNADYVLILEGTNDYYSGLSPQTTAYNLGVMIDICRSYNMEPVLATLTPHPGSSRDISANNVEISKKATEKGVLLVDLYGGLVSDWSLYSTSDNLHPNQSGYDAIAQIWFDALMGIATTMPDPDVLGTTATLYGSVNAYDEGADLFFQYGTTPSLDSTIDADPNYITTLENTLASAVLENLTINTTYYYRFAASVNGQTAYGVTYTFTTSIGAPWNILLLGEKKI